MKDDNVIYFYSRSESFFELSNFYMRAMIIGGLRFKSIEHYFQANKAVRESDFEMVRNCNLPSDAKALGSKILLRHDWGEIKEDVMLRGLREKFIQHEDLRMLLLSTGDAELKERSPRDMYWGYLGKNRLGILLMQVRDELNRNSKFLK